MKADTIDWMGSRVDKARKLATKIAKLKDDKEYFTCKESWLLVECGKKRLSFNDHRERRTALQEAIAGILDAEIAEAEAELEAI